MPKNPVFADRIEGVVHVPPNIPHIGCNASATEPLKVLIIRIKDKSKPVMVPAK